VRPRTNVQRNRCRTEHGLCFAGSGVRSQGRGQGDTVCDGLPARRDVATGDADVDAVASLSGRALRVHARSRRAANPAPASPPPPYFAREDLPAAALAEPSPSAVRQLEQDELTDALAALLGAAAEGDGARARAPAHANGSAQLGGEGRAEAALAAALRGSPRGDQAGAARATPPLAALVRAALAAAPSPSVPPDSLVAALEQLLRPVGPAAAQPPPLPEARAARPPSARAAATPLPTGAELGGAEHLELLTRLLAQADAMAQRRDGASPSAASSAAAPSPPSRSPSPPPAANGAAAAGRSAPDPELGRLLLSAWTR
jgi:hypothetical protein